MSIINVPQKTVPLCQAYKKSPKRITVRRESLRPEPVEINLSPVLYHGTAKYQADQWLLNGISHSTLSLTSRATHALPYASYTLSDDSQPRTLINTYLRRIAVGRFGIPEPDEYAEVLFGNVRNTVALFDRDTILESFPQERLFSDEGDGIEVLIMLFGQTSPLPFPTESLFATIDIERLNDRENEVLFRVHNPRLWADNFSIPIPFERQVFRLEPTAPLEFSQYLAVNFLEDWT